MSIAENWFDQHLPRLQRARQACVERACWSPFPELPARYPDADQAQARGLAAFQAHLGQDGISRAFALSQPGTVGKSGTEVSPYTGKPLAIDYPQADIDALFDAAQAAMPSWAGATIEQRLGVLMEVVERLYADHLFELTHAVMHTAGQSYNMAYAGSGVNALDRAIEALVYAGQAMQAVTPHARWERQFGPSTIALDKTYRLVPRGVAVCFACASFPTWNAWPSLMASLATTMCLFSAQMCTSPQNIYIPAQGVRTAQGQVPFDDVARQLADAVQRLTADPKKAAMILATIQSPQTLAMLQQLRAEGVNHGQVLLEPKPYVHPEFPDARTSTPLMLQVDTTQRALYAQERFGPVSFVIRCGDGADALTQATNDAFTCGGLTAFLYSTDEEYIARAEQAYASAGAQLTTNLTGAMPLNFAAAYSDYHVTGLNPAGNAALTSLAFVASRFCIAQSRRPVRDATTSKP